MAKTQTERLASLESDVTNIKESQKDTKVSIDKLHGKVDSLITYVQHLEVAQEKKFDSRYASKTVEKVVYAAIGIILTTVIVTVLATIGIQGLKLK